MDCKCPDCCRNIVNEQCHAQGCEFEGLSYDGVRFKRLEARIETLRKAGRAALKVIAKAEAEHVFDKCVNPNVGNRAYRQLREAIAESED